MHSHGVASQDLAIGEIFQVVMRGSGRSRTWGDDKQRVRAGEARGRRRRARVVSYFTWMAKQATGRRREENSAGG
jgi:hypothetical protein